MPVDRVPPADLVQDCAAEPPPPPDDADDREISLYWHDVRVSGRACRIKHRCLATWVKGGTGDVSCQQRKKGV